MQTGIIFQVFSNPNRKFENQAQFTAVKEKVFLFKFLFPKKVSFPAGSQQLLAERFKEEDEDYKKWDLGFTKKTKRPDSERSHLEQSKSENQASGQKSARPHGSEGPAQVPSLKFGLKNLKDYDSVEYRFQVGEAEGKEREKDSPMDDDSDAPSSHSSREQSSPERRAPPKLDLPPRNGAETHAPPADLPIKKLGIPKLGGGPGMPALNLGRPPLTSRPGPHQHRKPELPSTARRGRHGQRGLRHPRDGAQADQNGPLQERLL